MILDIYMPRPSSPGDKKSRVYINCSDDPGSRVVYHHHGSDDLIKSGSGSIWRNDVVYCKSEKPLPKRFLNRAMVIPAANLRAELRGMNIDEIKIVKGNIDRAIDRVKEKNDKEKEKVLLKIKRTMNAVYREKK